MAGLRASRGDDVELEDPDTAAFEARVARLAGKEAGLLCASATGSNQLAVRSLLAQPPHSIVVDGRAHHFLNEAGGAALFSQATTHTAKPANGLYLTAEDVEPVLQLGDDVHMAPTRLIVLENTMDGVIVPNEVGWAVRGLADAHGIRMHLDGARAWNAAAAALDEAGKEATEENLGEALGAVCAPFDTVSLCLSKSIGAPLGR
jgi:threonine aldolase